MAARAIAVVPGAAALAVTALAHAAAGDAAPRIPLVVGSTTIRSVAETQGDHESIRTTAAVSGAGYSLGYRAEVLDGASMREEAPILLGNRRPDSIERKPP